jgi:tetratricopeptide (TPR) repeat protein
MARKRPLRPARPADAPAKKNVPAMNKLWEPAGQWVLLFCTTLIAYGPALSGGMVWDDNRHVTAPALQSFHGLWRIWSELGATPQYYPLLHSAFWVEHRLWGHAVLGYHLANIVLHALSACLVVMIVRRLSLPGAWLAGFVFALHPVCVEGVAWISEQKSALSGVFYLAAGLTYLHFHKTRRGSWYFLALGLFVLALLSKTVTAVLPAALLVLLWWMRGRLEWRRDVLPLLPWLGLAVPAGLLTAWVERVYIGAQRMEDALTLPQRLLLAGRIPWFYASKALWPANLTFSYPRWKVDPGEWWQYVFPAGLVAVAIVLSLLARRSRGPLAAFLIFAGTLFPVLGFLNVYPFRYSYVADHFQYLAILAIIVPASAWLTVSVKRISPGRIGAFAVPALVVTILGVSTWRQSGMYRDEETLYRETLARNPGSDFARVNLGVLLARTDRLPEAIAEYQAALRADPSSAGAHLNLGLAYARTPGRLPEAIAEYRTALRINPGFSEAHLPLANALARLPGHMQEAIAEYGAALRIDPASVEAHINLGNALATMPDRLPDAVVEYQTALRIDPDSALAHVALGLTLARAGQMTDAIAEFQAALRIDPQSAAAHFNLGRALAAMPDRLPDAVEEYKASLRIDPEVAEAHFELAYRLAQLGRAPEAVAECQEALRINPSFEPPRQLMASLLASPNSLGR